MRSREWLTRLALAGLATVVTLALVEVALRVLGYEPIYRVYSHPEIFWRQDDLLGWSHEPGAQGIYVGPRPWPVEFEAPVRINSLGLRGPEIAPVPPGSVRVMVLGDSIVAGFEVPWEETFTARMESLLAQEGLPVQVVNAGVRGYGTDQSYLYYRDRGSRLQPDLVLFLPSVNDLADNVTLHRMRRVFGKGALSLRADGQLERVGYPIPAYPVCSEWQLDASFQPHRVDTGFERAMCGVQTRLADRSALFTFASLRIRQNPAMLQFLYRLGSPGAGAERLAPAPPDTASADAEVAPRRALNMRILRALAEEVRRQGAELLVPIRSPFAGELEPAPLAAEGVITFDIAEDYTRPEFHFEHDSHLNARGHELFARELSKVVAERLRNARAHAGS
jgi:lysophospholipase L1-like esterase